MFPLNGPAWSLFFEYIGNILYALFIRRLSTRALAILAGILSILLLWFTATDVCGYGMFGVGWTLDGLNFWGGLLRMLCPFTIGMLLSRVFHRIQFKVKGAFWISSIILLLLFHVPYIESMVGGSSVGSVDGIMENGIMLKVPASARSLATSPSRSISYTIRLCITSIRGSSRSSSSRLVKPGPRHSSPVRFR